MESRVDTLDDARRGLDVSPVWTVSCNCLRASIWSGLSKVTAWRALSTLKANSKLEVVNAEYFPSSRTKLRMASPFSGDLTYSVWELHHSCWIATLRFCASCSSAVF